MSAPDGIDPATGEVLPTVTESHRLAWQPMNQVQAREATDRVNTYAKRLPRVVKEAYDGLAWTALGYETWDEYVDDALVITRRYANMLLAAAVNLELLSQMFDIDVALFGIPERVLRGLNAGTMVPAVEEALAELTEDATDAEKVEVIESTVRKVSTTITKAKADATQAEKLEAAAQRGRDLALADLAKAQADKIPSPGPEVPAPSAPVSDQASGAAVPPTASEPEPGHVPSPAPGPSSGQNPATSSAGDAGPTGDEGGQEPAPALPATSPELEAAAMREAVSAAMVAARALLAMDPVDVVDLMTADDAETWCAHADDMADWAYRFEGASKNRNQLRSV